MRRALPPRLARLRNPIALLAVGIAGLVRGFDYLYRNELSTGTLRATSLIDSFLPLWAYATLWLAVSAAFLIGIFTQRGLFVWAGAFTVGLWGLWAVTFIASHFLYNTPSGLLTGTGFAAFGLAILALIQEEVEREDTPRRRVIE